MNKSESKYFKTALLMNKAFLELLDTKDFEYITVKEICEKAGVNRSTFYLHYETIADLLDESVEYMDRQFDSYFSIENRLNTNRIESTSLSELYLITPQYLQPYLAYVKDHRRVFRTAIEKAHVLGSHDKYNLLFREVLGPIMDRYRIPAEQRQLILSFYINGIMGIIKEWLKNDCAEPIELITRIIMECIKQPL